MKKMQVFTSSTDAVLLEERQSSVGAVLRSDNIPTGMKLFSVGNKARTNINFNIYIYGNSVFNRKWI